jgi:preprotein translocase subunit SecD
MSEEAVKAAEATEAVETTEAPIAQAAETVEETVNPQDVSYHAVEKEGNVTAIWEMQGPKHIRTIDPRSSEGKQILALFETAG